MTTGALLFGRYAFPPNRLGYCGPDAHQTLFTYVAEQRAEAGLVELERRFEGAYPYLRLIAEANEVGDPLDRAVVEAYWIGNAHLERVDGASFYAWLNERYRAQSKVLARPWLADEHVAAARPHHVFHVFDLYMRTGMLRDARAAVILKAMDSCRISWGEVVGVDGEHVLVRRPALALVNGRLALAEPRDQRILRRIDGQGFADDARPGDHVSIHWDWACEVLDDLALDQLTRATGRYLALVNAALAQPVNQPVNT